MLNNSQIPADKSYFMGLVSAYKDNVALIKQDVVYNMNYFSQSITS
jgi:hypothetical protein